MSLVGTRAVQNQMLCDLHGDSWCRCRDRPRMGEMADYLLSFLISPLSCVWLWSTVGHVLTQSQPLGY